MDNSILVLIHSFSLRFGDYPQHGLTPNHFHLTHLYRWFYSWFSSGGDSILSFLARSRFNPSPISSRSASTSSLVWVRRYPRFCLPLPLSWVNFFGFCDPATDSENYDILRAWKNRDKLGKGYGRISRLVKWTRERMSRGECYRIQNWNWILTCPERI